MKKRSYKFTDKKHTKQGICSTLLGLAALILLSVGVGMAYQTFGNARSMAGLLGLLSMLASVLGFVLAIQGFREDDVYYLFSPIGMIVNGSLFILWTLIFVAGM